MSNAISCYARAWHLRYPTNDLTVVLLAVAPEDIWKANILSFPKLHENDQAELTTKVLAFQELHKDAIARSKDQVDLRFHAFSSLPEAERNNIWANDGIFTKYYRAWKAAIIDVGLPIPILPGWPPVRKDGDGEYDYTKDMMDDIKAAMHPESENYDDIPDEEVKIPVMRFPENVEDALRIQVATWVCACFNQYDNQNFVPIAQMMIRHSNLSFKQDDEDGALYFFWVTDAAFMEAEKKYIDKYTKYSPFFQRYLSSHPGEPAGFIKELDGHLKFALKYEEERMRKGKGKVAESSMAADPDTPKGETPAEPGDEASPIIVADDKEMHEFDDSLRMEIKIPDNCKAFLDIVPPLYMKIVEDKYKIRNLPPSVENVRVFIRDNDLDETELDDAAFAGVMLYLMKGGAISHNSGAAHSYTFTNNENLQVSEIKLRIWEKAARRMIDASFAFASQGAKDGELSWYDSFSAVYGRIMKPRRFVQVCEMIMAGDILEHYSANTPISTIRSANNVIGYRLTRLSSPSLVIEAMLLIDSKILYRMIDPSALKSYVRFHSAGILAQVAAGPLKVYCKGNVDVLTTTNIPQDLKISELKVIDKPPYDGRLLRQAYIVLEAYGKLPTKWYQGMRAMRGSDTKDSTFEVLVKAFKAAEKAAADDLVLSKEKIDIEEFLLPVKTYDEVKCLLDRRGSGF